MKRAAAGRRGALRGGTPQERLLAAATELFTRHGYAATPVRTIVERAGVTKPVLYYHFGSKEGMYLTLVERLLMEFEAGLARGARATGSARARIGAMCDEVVRLVDHNLEPVRLFYGIFYGPQKSAPSFDFVLFPQKVRAAIDVILRDGISTREIERRRVTDLALAIEAMLSFIVETAVSEPERRLSNRDLGRLIDLVFAGAAAAPRPITKKSATPKEIRK
jgi:AcrR family transcriptional regulator